MTAFMRSSIRTSEFKMLFADSFCIPQVFETAVLQVELSLDVECSIDFGQICIDLGHPLSV
jgi:hypothetical protein